MVAGVSYDWFDLTKARVSKTDKAGALIGQADAGKPDKIDAYNPMIGATYNYSEFTKFFGSAARKVRFPTLDQLYLSKGGNLNLT